MSIHERLNAVVAKLVNGHLSPEDAATTTDLLDDLRALAEAADTGELPRERCEDEAALVVQRLEALLAKA
jgi:hypothetical protein